MSLCQKSGRRSETWIDPEFDPVAGELHENEPNDAFDGLLDESESDGTSMLTSGGRWWIEYAPADAEAAADDDGGGMEQMCFDLNRNSSN
jgi:hypothetical protein